jgi:2Fe-2S ferredoxin
MVSKPVRFAWSNSAFSKPDPLLLEIPLPKIYVTLLNGDQREVLAAVGQPLMHALRDQTLDVEAVCGGAASCATCHVYIDTPSILNMLPSSAAEKDMLDGLIHQRPASRLSCQIIVEPSHDGLAVTIAPAET